METMDSYGLTCKGGPGPYVRRARHSHKEDRAQGSIQMVTTQGLERQESKELSPVKGEGAVYRKLASRSCRGGAVSKESTQLKRHRGAKQESVRGLAPETQVGLSKYSVTIKLCDSYCLGIGDYRVVQWRSLYILS